LALMSEISSMIDSINRDWDSSEPRRLNFRSLLPYSVTHSSIMSTPKYKLVYFNVRALAEVSRLLFSVAGIEFEDYRYPIDTSNFSRPEWDADKAKDPFKYPFGTIPVLEVDGKQIAQSKVIERYLARKFNLLGSDESQSLLIESIIEEISDIKAKWNALKETDRNKYFDTELPKYFGFLDRIGGSGHFVGSSISYADISFFNFVDNHDNQDRLQQSLSGFPNLKAVAENVGKHAGVVAWIAKRPKTAF